MQSGSIPPNGKEPDIVGLKKFVQRSDRGRPLHFVGRKQELKQLREALDSVTEAADGSAYGKTQLITAAPGAGKSALLYELEERWEEEKIARVVQLRVSTLADRTETFRELLTQLSPAAAERLGTTTIEGATVGFSQIPQATRHTGKQRTQEWPRTVDAVARWL